MSRIIVNALSAQLMPIFLLIKALSKENDVLYFLTTAKYNKISPLQYALNLNMDKFKDIRTLYLNDMELNDWNQLQEKLHHTFANKENNEYIINLTGGTKLEALALYLYFKDKKAQFYYMPFPQQYYINLETNEKIPIKYSASPKEYFLLCDLEYNQTDGQTFPPNYTEVFFDKWLQFNDEEYSALSILKDFKAREITDWETVRNSTQVESFLRKISLPPDWNQNTKSRDKSIKYLLGIWFEEYIRNYLSRILENPVYSARIKLKETSKDNELDATFVYNNTGFIIECKTSLESKWITKAIDKLGNLSSNTVQTISIRPYFVYLKKSTKKSKDHERNQEIKNINEALNKAKAQNIRVFGLEDYPDKDAFLSAIITQIKKDAGT